MTLTVVHRLLGCHRFCFVVFPRKQGFQHVDHVRLATPQQCRLGLIIFQIRAVSLASRVYLGHYRMEDVASFGGSYISMATRQTASSRRVTERVAVVFYLLFFLFETRRLVRSTRVCFVYYRAPPSPRFLI